MSCNVAVNINCYGQGRNVCGELLDVYAESSGLAAETLRADAERVDLLKQLVFHVSPERIGVALVKVTGKLYAGLEAIAQNAFCVITKPGEGDGEG